MYPRLLTRFFHAFFNIILRKTVAIICLVMNIFHWNNICADVKVCYIFSAAERHMYHCWRKLQVSSIYGRYEYVTVLSRIKNENFFGQQRVVDASCGQELDKKLLIVCILCESLSVSYSFLFELNVSVTMCH